MLFSATRWRSVKRPLFKKYKNVSRERKVNEKTKIRMEFPDMKEERVYFLFFWNNDMTARNELFIKQNINMIRHSDFGIQR